ncbi:MAG: hypothetical protein ACK4IX_02300 [Candidatus Sericytochromatia bacterium]
MSDSTFKDTDENDDDINAFFDELNEFISDDISQQDVDSETESFFNDLSDFLDEEENKYLDKEDLDEVEYLEDSDMELPLLSSLEEEYDDENNYEEDDEETALLRSEASNIALGLMNYVEYNVINLENELSILGDAFNQLLDKTHLLDDKISALSEKINKSRVEGSKQALTFIHNEIKLISDNLEGAIGSTDPNDFEVLLENVEIMTQNKKIIEDQIKGLKEIGANTDKLDKDVKVFEESIFKLQSAINSNEVFKLSSIISGEIKQVLNQITHSRKAEDEHDISLLNENLDLLMDNKADIEEKMWDIFEKGISIDGLREQLEVLTINLEQFSRTIDDTVYQISMSTNKKNKK